MSSIPIYIVTGFLGSGKTTLLSRLLDEGTLHDTALIINEFGDIGIDHLLVEQGSQEVVELSNGCLCCTFRGEIIDTLSRLVKTKNLERIIIETTGLCDPAPLLRAIIQSSDAPFHFHTLITAFDTPCGIRNLEHHQEAKNQVMFADIIVFTKTDITPITEFFTTSIHQLNPNAQTIISQDTSTLSSILLPPDSTPRELPISTENSHVSSYRSFTLRVPTPIAISRLHHFLDIFTFDGLLRVKGIMYVYDSARPDGYACTIQGVQGVFAPLVFPEIQITESRLVIIADIRYSSAIEKLFNALLNNTAIDSPDFDAIDSNPLSIPNWQS